jgi:hypothetical protein
MNARARRASSQKLKCSFTMIRSTGDRGHYRGALSFKQTDYITPISSAGGTVKVKDEVRTRYNRRVLQRATQWARTIKRDAVAVGIAARDPRVPWYAKVLAASVC